MTRVRPLRTQPGRHSRGVRAWQCPTAPEAHLVVLAELPGAKPLEQRLSPPYSAEQAALLADAAVSDTLQALGTLPTLVSDTVSRAFRLLSGPSLLIGTETPQLDAGLLAESAALLGGFDAVLGPTTGPGWWAFGVRDPELVGTLMPALRDTAGLALAALRQGLRVAMLPTMRAVHTVEDAHLVAGRCAPGSRFALTVARLQPEAC
jgi:glycosyltransferase A (GT-A) superfamily protein (DUF2064 family)